MATKASAGGLALPPPGDIPAELRQRDQWVGWIYGDAGRKLPLNPKTGKAASVADSETWTPFEIAYRYAQKRRCGLGFVFTAGDDLCGADFDDCRSTDDGSIKIGVWQTIEALASYSEVSPSGTGIKIICRAKLPQPFKGARLELYDRARFFTITGQHVRGTPTAINEAQGAIDVLLAEHSRGNGHRTEPIPEAIQEGQRNAVLTSLAGSLRARGLGQGVIEMALEGVNAAQCQPPLSEGEVKSIAQSIARYPAPISLHLTDLGNAERLVARHGHDLHYCYAWAAWLCWDGCRWQVDTVGEIYRRAKETIRALYREAADTENDGDRRDLVKHAKGAESDSRLLAMVHLAQSEPNIPVLPRNLDADPWLLNCLNGTLNLETGQLREHRREDLITKQAPVQYNPDAQLPLWDRALGEIGDPELGNFLQRAVEYSLTGVTGEEKLFFVHGPAATIKSTFIEAVKATLGDYAKTADFEIFLKRSFVGGGAKRRGGLGRRPTRGQRRS